MSDVRYAFSVLPLRLEAPSQIWAGGWERMRICRLDVSAQRQSVSNGGPVEVGEAAESKGQEAIASASAIGLARRMHPSPACATGHACPPLFSAGKDDG